MTSVPSSDQRSGEGRSGPDVQAAFVATLVDEWVRGGVVHAVVCPGSRSTPLALGLESHPSIRVHMCLDERSAAFTALGMGLATGVPAALVTTSGTAAAELHAAVVEADLAGVPLLVVTADRPPELRGTGAPQTIDQAHLFGRSVRLFADPGVADCAARSMWRSFGARVAAATTDHPDGPGPVHCNLPFREPLLGDADAGGGVPKGRPDGAAWHRRAVDPAPPPGWVVEMLATAAVDGTTGMIVAGAGCGNPSAILAWAGLSGWPVVADARSGLRTAHPMVVAAADGIFRSSRFTAEHRPDVVVQLGMPWVSKVVTSYVSELATEGTSVVAVEAWGRRFDPDGMVAVAVRADPGLLSGAVVDRLSNGPASPPRPHLPGPSSWAEAERVAQDAIERYMYVTGGASEPAVARRILAALPDQATLVVSSSMPVRDIEAFGAPRAIPLRVLSNRGANGIDGVVSTAIGVAGATGGPTVALVGDLAFLHDVSALLCGPGLAVRCTVVVIDNGGGGIFSFLPQAAALDVPTFDALLAAPPATDVAAVAAGFGLRVDDLGPPLGPGVLEEALLSHLELPGLSVIRVRVDDRHHNVATHARINQAIVDAVDGTLGLVTDT